MATNSFPTAVKFWAEDAVRTLLHKYNTGAIPGNKITDQQVHASTRLQAIAAYYLDQYLGNTGANAYLDSMLSNRKRGYTLTASQLRGTLNCMLAEYKRYAAEIERAVLVYNAAALGIDLDASSTPAQAATPTATPEVLAPAPQPVTGPVVPVVRDGIYTVVIDETGTYRTLKISTVPEDKRSHDLPEGVQYVGYLSGPDNSASYTGCGYLFGSSVRLGARYKVDTTLTRAIQVLVAADTAKQGDYGHAYAMASGNCWRCGRVLTVPASINRGLGPICADKY